MRCLVMEDVVLIKCSAKIKNVALLLENDIKNSRIRYKSVRKQLLSKKHKMEIYFNVIFNWYKKKFRKFDLVIF